MISIPAPSLWQMPFLKTEERHMAFKGSDDAGCLNGGLQMNPDIEWRASPSAPKYLVSSDGQVRHSAKDRPLKQWRATGGYPSVTLWINGDVNRTIHSLVAEAFIGPRPIALQVRHLDGNPRNNRIENLAYGTVAENVADRIRHGRQTGGGPPRTLSDDDVETIRRLYAAGNHSQRALAAMFNCSQPHVGDVIRRKYRAARRERAPLIPGD